MPLSILSELSQHPLFAGLPVAAVEHISDCAANVTFSPGDLMISEGAHAGYLYLLRQGKVALSAHAPGKGHLLVQTLGPGEVVGLSWLFEPFQWQFDVRAVEFVEAVALDGACMRAKFDANPPLGYQLLSRIMPVVLARLQQTRVRLLDLYSSAPDRDVNH
jgi:CRP-like cAMP-binding protein